MFSAIGHMIGCCISYPNGYPGYSYWVVHQYIPAVHCTVDISLESKWLTYLLFNRLRLLAAKTHITSCGGINNVGHFL